MVGLIDRIAHITRVAVSRTRATRSSCSASRRRELGGERVSGAHPRRRRGRRRRRATSSAERALIDALLEAITGGRRSRRRTIAATAASPSRSPSAASWIASAQRGATVDLTHWRDLPDARPALRRGAGARRSSRRRCRTPCSRVAQRPRRAGPRHRHGGRRWGPVADYDCSRSRIAAPLAELDEAYHEAIPRIMSQPRTSRRSRDHYAVALVDRSRSDHASQDAEAMCGIFGVHGHADATHIAQLGLYSLQHRGQESVGVVSIDDGRAARAPCGAWARCPTRSARSWPSFPASSAVGHTRYSTSGSSTIENAQPVVARSKGGYITLAHNGNLDQRRPSCASSSRSRDRSSRRRTTRRSSSTGSRARTPRRRPSVSPTRCSAVDGAYSLIVAMGDTLHGRARSARLAAARDGSSSATPSCSRPRRARSTSSARRSSATSSRARSSRSNGTGVHVDASRSGKQDLKRCVFEYVYFARPDSRVFGGSVDRARRALGRRLGAGVPRPGRGSRVQRSRFVELRGARLRRGERAAVRAGADSQPLRRPHVHPAHAGRPRREGEGEVQSRCARCSRARAS